LKPLSELREQVWEANMELPRKNLVIYTFGNVSGIDRVQGIIAIKPSGIPYEKLTPDNIVLVDMDGTVIDSRFNPSSDTMTHLVLYRHFETIGGIVHTHSTYATSWAQALKPIPCLGTTHADHIRGEIPCTEVMTDEEIRGNYEERTGLKIIERFRGLSPDDVPMVLVAGHGPFTWGHTPENAVYNGVILEELARLAFYTLSIDPAAGGIPGPLLDRHYFRKHGDSATYGQVET